MPEVVRSPFSHFFGLFARGVGWVQGTLGLPKSPPFPPTTVSFIRRGSSLAVQDVSLHIV